MFELPPEVEQQLADMTSDDWAVLCARVRPPEEARTTPPIRSEVLVGVPEAAEYLDLDHRTVRSLITDGTLPAYKIGGRNIIRIKVKDLETALVPITPGEGRARV